MGTGGNPGGNQWEPVGTSGNRWEPGGNQWEPVGTLVGTLVGTWWEPGLTWLQVTGYRLRGYRLSGNPGGNQWEPWWEPGWERGFPAG